MTAADDAVARAREIAARLSGQPSSAPPMAAAAPTNGYANGSVSTVDNSNPSSATDTNAAPTKKRRRWGVSDDAAAATTPAANAATAPATTPAALPGLEDAAKRMKMAMEPTQKRVWVNTTSERTAYHFVKYVQIPPLLQDMAGASDLKIEFKGRGSTGKPPLPGIPEEPLHILVSGLPKDVDVALDKVEAVLRQAEVADPLVDPNAVTNEGTSAAATGQPSQTSTQQQQQQQHNLVAAESIAAQAADALAAAMNPTGGAAAATGSTAGYKPVPVAQLIGVGGNDPSGGHYGPGGEASQMLEEQIGVPNGVVGFIIGRGGESISSMQARSGARVQIQKEHEMAPGQTQRVITLTASSKESIDACRDIIQGMVQERMRTSSSQSSSSHYTPGGGGAGGGTPMITPGTGATSQAAKLQEALSAGHAHVTVQVPDADVGLIIGKGGTNIKNIQDQSGANVQIPPQADVDNPMVRTVNVTHPHPEGANLAKQLIEGLLNSKTQNNAHQGGGGGFGGGGGAPGGAGAPGGGQQTTLQVYIPDKDVGMCIGRAGCVIKEMQNKSGTRIQIPSHPTPGQPHRICTVQGTPEGCQQVQEMIHRIIQEQSSQAVMAGTGYQNQQQQQGGYGGQQQGGYHQGGYGGQQQQQQYGAYGQQQQASAATTAGGASSTGGQKDYSAEWAAYYAAQAAAGANGAAASATPAAAATPTAAAATSTAAPAAAAATTTSSTTSTAGAPAAAAAAPGADAYYDQFFRYAYHYGEDAARKYYGAWSPPVGTTNPYGTNPNPSPAPAQAATGSTSATATTAAAPAAAAPAPAATPAANVRDTSVRKVSNLPAWMTKGQS
jgi:far upstream element-binding protein